METVFYVSTVETNPFKDETLFSMQTIETPNPATGEFIELASFRSEPGRRRSQFPEFVSQGHNI